MQTHRDTARGRPGLEPGPLPPPRRLARRAGRIAIVVFVAVALLVLGGIGLFRSSGKDTAPAAKPPPGSLQAPSLPTGSLTGNIAGLQDRLRSDPNDWGSWGALGFAYVQQARVSADPTFYPKAEGALQRSLSLHPDGNYVALAGMGSLAAARHDFAAALDWGVKARAINPYNANIRAIIGDAYLELGRYDQGFAEFQKMIDLRPDIATYARVSYAQELQGNIPDAIKGMQLAYQSSGTAADAAWASYYLGELYFNSGRLDAADREYRRGVALDGAFIPNHQGIAKVEAARGQTDAAIRDYRWVVERYPLPSYVIELGDLYMVTGQADQAAQQYALVKAERQLFQANGVNMDLDIALFDADHGVDLAEGLAAARAEWDRRQSVLVADALGWSLYANGQFREALTYAERSLELGTRSALFLFHKGTIEKALGRTGAARRDLAAAIDINPSFSILWSRSAAEALASLGGAP